MQTAINRYEKILINSGATPVCNTDEGDSLDHLLWMVGQLNSSELLTTQKHRWLGYIQGVLIAKHMTTVDAERDATRGTYDDF